MRSIGSTGANALSSLKETDVTFQTIVFYVFAAILILAALLVVTTRNPVHAALWLVLSFFSAAGIWLLLQAEFLAIALVLVYVGAVMVLFLFVVMMLDVNFGKMRERFRSYIPVAVTVGILVLVEMLLVLLGGYLGGRTAPPPAAAGYSNTKTLGLQIYTDYAYPFEIAAMILLVAIIAAIALTHRQRRKTKYQNPSAQVRVRRDDRLRIVRMPAEKREP
jgi:NADH-quinone oxidoreductase subunit J